MVFTECSVLTIYLLVITLVIPTLRQQRTFRSDVKGFSCFQVIIAFKSHYNNTLIKEPLRNLIKVISEPTNGGIFQVSLYIFITKLFSPFIHPIIDNRIDTRVGHGEPVEQEEHVLREPGLRTTFIIQSVMEIKSLRPGNLNIKLRCLEIRKDEEL